METKVASTVSSRDSSRFETVTSTTSLLSQPNSTYGYLGISFAYQTLSKEVDTYFTSYTLTSFWGDFAGMLGTVMGLDLIKTSSGLPLFYVAKRLRSINPIEDHFNG